MYNEIDPVSLSASRGIRQAGHPERVSNKKEVNPWQASKTKKNRS